MSPEPEQPVKKLLTTTDPQETRVAVLENDRLAELYGERTGGGSLVGNIYKGRVDNVLAGMDAAFVDIGMNRNGFLYVDDVETDDEEDRNKKITQLLKAGQELVVQVTKDPMGTKGPRLTTEISIAGRYLVYVPGGSLCGVSRRLPDEERQRLRDLCRDIKPKDAGVIIRTVAEGVSERAITNDLKYLEKVWGSVQRRIDGQGAPSLVYTEADLPLRIVRDLFSEEFSEILVDEEGVQKRIASFLQSTTPELVDRVELYQGARPLFETYGIDKEIDRALKRRVDLPSGGYLVIDYTEALTVIDVNTGRYVGRKQLEDTILKTNVEACREVVRQLRIRDIGGIVVIDFIDMGRRQNREQVLATLEQELAKDRTKTYVVELSPLGLVEMTRQNITDGLRGFMTEQCPTCGGEGVVLSPETLAIEVERRLRELLAAVDAEAALVEVHPDVAEVLLDEEDGRVAALERETGKELIVEGVGHLLASDVRIAAQGSRELIERSALPVSDGQELDVRIDEVHAYNRRDGVGRLDGYVVSVSGAANLVGKTVTVVVDRAMRHYAEAHLEGPEQG